MSELPLVTVLALAALVLALGLRDDSSSVAPDAMSGGDAVHFTTALAMAPPTGDAASDGVTAPPELAQVLTGDERRALASSGSEHARTGSRPVSAPLQSTPDSDVAVDRATDILIRGGHGSDDLSAPREGGQFHRGVRHGEWITRYEDGSVHELGEYDEGLRDGLWQTFSASGSLLMEAAFADGLQHGAWRRYADSGDLVGEGLYVENQRSGRWTVRYSNGSVKERGRYENGLREGLWEFFDDLGRPTLRSGNYRSGILVD